MARKQTIIWTALPSGFSASGRLKLSVFVAPRLETDEGLPRPQLSQFADFVSWASKAKGIQFKVQFEGTDAVPADLTGPALEPDLWSALFKDTTYVEPYKFDDLTNRNVLSQPVGHLDTFVKTQYQTIAAGSPTRLPLRSTLATQLAPVMLYNPPEAAPPAASPGTTLRQPMMMREAQPAPGRAAARPEMRQVVIPDRLQNFIRTLRPEQQTRATRDFKALVRQPNLTVQPAALTAFQDVHMDLQQYKAVRPMPQPQPARDFLQARLYRLPVEIARTPLQPPEIDFHKVLSSLGNYPELMRRLGLVLDLEVTPPSGVGASSTVRVLPTWPADSPPASFHTDFTPRTAYVLDKGKSWFAPRPSKPDSGIADGMLNLSDNSSFPVLQVDIDGAATKITHLADRLAVASSGASSTTLRPMMLETRPNDPPQERMNVRPTGTAPIAEEEQSAPAAPPVAALPALRSAGLAVARAGRATWLVDTLSSASKNNQAVQNNQPDQVTLYAEDVVRGYRVDIWDSQTSSWHSACRRHGVYTFFESNLTREYEDEGFVQLSVTHSPSDGSSQSNATPDLYVTEAMFRWDGWSLAAPRPGKSVNAQGVPERLSDLDSAKQRAQTEFKMYAAFTPVPGSLPRLRFGTTYRLRARVVDVAGNSLRYDAPDPADFSKASAPHPYTRFEPVVAPLVVLTKPLDGTKSPGESLERLVLRSNFDKSASEYSPQWGGLVGDSSYADFTVRLAAPPKTSQLMAERHGMFDLAGRGMKQDADTYKMIAEKADGAFTVDPLTRLPIQSALSIPYLPDPISRGASLVLVGLDGTPQGTVQPLSFYPSGTDWPQATPFLVKVVEGTGKTVWAWDEGSRTLTVRLPKAEVATFQLSSLLGDGQTGQRNQEIMGVWSWTVQAKPSNLSEIRTAILQGRHWMVTPSRNLVLVHAVQQPLIAPLFHQLNPNRHLGETFAYIFDDQPMPIDGKSTLKLDVQAAWQEPIDDLTKPGPETIQGTAHVWERKINATDTQIAASLRLITPVAAHPAATVAEPVPKKELKTKGKAKTREITPMAVETQRQPETTLARPAALSVPMQIRPGMRIPSDVRLVRPPETLGPIISFGYSFRHDFGDTKYRKVHYQGVATTRFAEYFRLSDPTQQLKLTRESPTVDVDVPNSARPAHPNVLYAVPTFGWGTKTDVKFEKKKPVPVGPVEIPGLKGVGTVSTRLGGGLRVYMDRPWFSSGAGELLGVVVWPNPAALPQAEVTPARPEMRMKAAPKASKQRGKVSPAVEIPRGFLGGLALEVPTEMRALVTQWGMDPVWQSSPLPSDLPKLENFKNTQQNGTGFTLDELAGHPEQWPGYYKVAVAGYMPEYDTDRQLWYCDIQIDFGQSYYPFVRLALVRYQPISIENAHLSRVILADFAQLAPDRGATIVVDPNDRNRVDIAVTGLMPGGSAARTPNQVEVSVETQPVGADSDLGWIPAPDGTIPLQLERAGPTPIWRGQIQLHKLKLPKHQAVRFVIKEYEVLLADSSAGAAAVLAMAAASPAAPARRLVYANVLTMPGGMTP